MKSDNKNKPSSSKICHNSSNNAKTLQNFNLNRNHYQGTSNQWNDETTHFYLNDQQPESINAKRKLQQISVELQDRKVINPHKRNQNTINLLKRSQKAIEQTENAGWTNQVFAKEKSLPSHKNQKYNRALSATRSQLRQPTKLKEQGQKKHSFNSSKNANKKINLSFNNLLPVNMETIHQTQMSKEIIKKVKSIQVKRPNTAYYAPSQKILTLFDKDNQQVINNAQTLRIHSGKEVESKNNNPITLKDRQRFLKTSCFNGFYMGSKKGNTQDANSKFLSSNHILSSQNQNHMFQNKQKIVNSNSHCRTYSEPIKQVSKQNKCHQNQMRSTLSNRKNQLMTDKRNIINKKLKSHRILTATDAEFNSTGRYNKSQQNSENYLPHQMQMTQENKKFPEERSDLNNTTKTSNQKYQKTAIQATTSSNLQQDFSLLINLLKNQSQNVFGGQLHSYLNHMKNNYQYSCYFSTGLNNKKKGKTCVATSKNVGKVLKSQNNTESLNFNVILSDQQMTKNNTLMHYTSLSSSKHKSKESGFLIGSNSGVKKQFEK